MSKTKLQKKSNNKYSKSELKAAINAVLAKEKTVAQASRDSGIIWYKKN